MLDGLWTRSVTITGGGEPLLYTYIDDLIIRLSKTGIKIGLVTNGTKEIWDHVGALLTWVRFSCSDDREINTDVLDKWLLLETWSGHKPDLAFSYVVTSNIDFSNLAKVVNYANKNNFTHVRLVSDIMNSSCTHNLKVAKKFFEDVKIDDSKVIYQPRSIYTKGTEKCLISLLKPMIYSDGYVYPCCGSQYSLIGDTGEMPKRMKMGYYTELPEIISKQKYFKGNICDVCYYEQYNQCLSNLLEDMKHVEFV